MYYTGEIAPCDFHAKLVLLEFVWSFHVNFTFTSQFTWKISREIHMRWFCLFGFSIEPILFLFVHRLGLQKREKSRPFQ